MTSRRHVRWMLVAVSAVAAVCLTISGTTAAQMSPAPTVPIVPIVPLVPLGPTVPLVPLGPTVPLGPIKPIEPYPCPGCVILPPPPPPPPPCPECVILPPPPPPPPPCPECVISPRPCQDCGTTLPQNVLISPLDNVLAPTGVPLPSANEGQADDEQLRQAIHAQWLRYLQSVQENHRDEHWKEAPYDAWLRRHPEDQDAVPATPQTEALPAEPAPEPATGGSWWIVGAIAAALVSLVLFRKRKSRR